MKPVAKRHLCVRAQAQCNALHVKAQTVPQRHLQTPLNRPCNDILQTAIRELHVRSYRLSAAAAGPLYLYSVHLVFVSANSVDEVLLLQPMTVQSFFQLFLYSNMHYKSLWRQKH